MQVCRDACDVDVTLPKTQLSLVLPIQPLTLGPGAGHQPLKRVVLHCHLYLFVSQPCSPSQHQVAATQARSSAGWSVVVQLRETVCNLSKRLWIWGTSALFCVCGENVRNGFPKPGILACLTFSPVLRLCLCPVGGLGAGLPSPLQHPELLEKFHSCFGVCPELPPCCAGAVSSTNR